MTNMSPEQIALVQSSFSSVMPRADQVAQDFYHRLFTAEPSFRAMFPRDMAEQRRKLMLTLTGVVQELARLDAIAPAIRALAVRHVRYGVEERHYPLVGAALIAALRGEVAGFGDEHAAAWSVAYALIADTMIRAAYR